MTTIYSALFGDDAHLEKYGKLEVIRHPSQMKDNKSILILHGGADISPSIYKHKVSKYTHADRHLSSRDVSEVTLAKRAIELGIPIFGICRGAQLSCALAGGSLIQHVTDHNAGSHEIITTDNKVYKTTSCHHQMMNLNGTDHELLATAAPSRSACYIVEGDKEIELDVEPEVVYFPSIKALAIQGHPEWMDKSTPFIDYCFSLVEDKFHDVLQ